MPDELEDAAPQGEEQRPEAAEAGARVLVDVGVDVPGVDAAGLGHVESIAKNLIQMLRSDRSRGEETDNESQGWHLCTESARDQLTLT